MNTNKDLYCLIGDPVSHSLSPAIQNGAFRLAGMKAVYIPVKVRKEELGRYVKILRELDVRGMNVTMPHKIEVMRHIDRLDDTAEKIGSVNTIVNERGNLRGYNTDVTGAVEAIRELIPDLKGKRAAILGRGGMARAVSYGLEEEGAETKMLGRNEMRAESISRELEDADIICNCTPIGMNGEPSPVPSSLLGAEKLVVDAAYSFHKTELIRMAERKGCRTVTGIRILVNQGANSFRLWTRLNPDRDAMMAAAHSRISEMKKRRRRNIYLIGSAGSGKTSAGRHLSEFLNRKFVDTDELIARESGRSVRDIIEGQGEFEFRNMERSVIEMLSRKQGYVVATGGGVVLSYDNIYRMKESGMVFLLDASPETVYERLKGDSSHPLLNGKRGRIDYQKVVRLYSLRKNYYDISKDYEVSTNGKGVEMVAAEIGGKVGDLD